MLVTPYYSHFRTSHLIQYFSVKRWFQTNSAELVALASDCVAEFGHSALADIINAGVCPHFYFSACMKNLIEPDTSFCTDPQKVEEMKHFLKANIPKDVRQLAKAVNTEIDPSWSNPCRIRK